MTPPPQFSLHSSLLRCFVSLSNLARHPDPLPHRPPRLGKCFFPSRLEFFKRQTRKGRESQMPKCTWVSAGHRLLKELLAGAAMKSHRPWPFSFSPAGQALDPEHNSIPPTTTTPVTTSAPTPPRPINTLEPPPGTMLVTTGHQESL